MQLSSCKYFWDSHVCLLINKWATCDIYFFHSSFWFLSHPYWVVLTHPGEAATQWTSELLRIHSAPMVMAYDAWSLWDTKVMLHLALLCLSGLHSMRSLSVVLAFTHIQEDFGENSFYFILCSQLNFSLGEIRVHRELSRGQSQVVNTTPCPEVAFPSHAWFSTSCEDGNFTLTAPLSLIPMDSWWAWLPHFSRHVQSILV